VFFILSLGLLICSFAHAEPEIDVSTSLLDFGSVVIGATKTDTVIVSNLGKDVLIVRLYMAFPILDMGFTVDMTPFELQAGESRAVEVTFSPVSEGPVTGIFTLANNDPDDSAVDVALSGKGVPVPESGFTVGVAVTAAGAGDLENVLGTATKATDGFDGLLDLPEPPPAPADFITGFFPHPEWGAPVGDLFMSDIRAPFDPWSDSRAWPFFVETDLGDTVTLAFSPSFPDTIGWDLWLRNDATGELVDLLPTLTYAFMPDAGPHAFTIFVGPRTLIETSGVPDLGGALRLRNAPNPFNPVTEFLFHLPREGKTDIRIFDLRGAEVGRVRGGVLSAGPGVLRWEGKDRRGRNISSGNYFYRLYLEGKPLGKTQKMTLLK
jgi:hypothetical protein